MKPGYGFCSLLDLRWQRSGNVLAYKTDFARKLRPRVEYLLSVVAPANYLSDRATPTAVRRLFFRLINVNFPPGRLR